MIAKPARGRKRFPAQAGRRITYQVGTELFLYEFGVALSQENGRYHVISGTTRETFNDRTAAIARHTQLVRINKNLGLG